MQKGDGILGLRVVLTTGTKRIAFPKWLSRKRPVAEASETGVCIIRTQGHAAMPPGREKYLVISTNWELLLLIRISRHALHF